MPTDHTGSPLEAALSFYSSIVTVNAEGDSLVSDETLEGLGTAGFLLQALFGSLLRIANPDATFATTTAHTPRISQQQQASSEVVSASSVSTSNPPSTAQLPSPSFSSAGNHEPQQPSSSSNNTAMSAAVAGYGPAAALPPQILGGSPPTVRLPVKRPYDDDEPNPQAEITAAIIPDVSESSETVKSKLTDLLPEPGYFLAGAVSGGVSRTATAPLDRLKVYLLVNTTPAKNAALAAAKSGRPLAALRNAGAPIVDAVMTLWRAGGIRTFFAGKAHLFLIAVMGRTKRLLTKNTGNGLNVVKIMPESAIRVSGIQKYL